MIRLHLIVLQVFGVILFKFLFIGDVSVSIDAPGQINAGSEIKVQITINKGDLQGFSRFQMELPAGLTAENVASANADFSFKDQKVRYIWLRLPDDETFTIAFTVKCYERLKGNFDLTGKFSFIADNERKNIDIQPKAVAIVPSPTIDPNFLVDIKDFGKMSVPQLGTPGGNVVCIRQTPAWSDSRREYMVNLLVNKESLKKFAKIEETVPAGYTAVNVDSKEGIFTFKDGKAKFLWMNLPADPFFTVSYKLLPAKGTTTKEQPAINGVFSYITEDKTLSVNITEQDVSLANLTADKVKEILLGQSQTLVAANITPPVKETNTANTNTAANTLPQKVETKQPEIKEPETKTTVTPEQKKPDQTVAAAVKQTVKVSKEGESSDMLEPESGIYYRVQLAAGHRPVNIKSYFRKYKLDNTIQREEHNGWYKYSVGSFNMYKDARDYRVHIWNTTAIADAFVSAYNNGKRITVQEALMVANQKWYK